ncbi:hypothetical protein BU16DRAFT_486118, partial [Lophium mytilinum]
MRFPTLSTLFSSSLLLQWSTALATRNSVHTVHQLPKPTWIENIAARADGHLLVSLLTTPDLNLINPFANPPATTLIHSFPPDLGLLGITEITPNKFVILSGNLSLTTITAPPGEFAAWLVDFSAPAHSTTPAIRKLSQLPSDTGLANGLTALNPHTVLISDSTPGRLLSYNLHTNTFATVLADPATMAPAPNPGNIKIGINGLKYRDGYAYYTNIYISGLYRVAVDCETGAARGVVETLTTKLGEADDFAFTERGDVVVATDSGNTVLLVSPPKKGKGEWSVKTIAGAKDALTVAGGTSVAMGRTAKDRGVAYVATQGGLAGPVNGVV